MAMYLVVHTPREEADDVIRPPSRLQALAERHGGADARPRWIRVWSPDLHDERIFSLWDAVNADEIVKAIAAFGFLDTMDAHPVNVREWGPSDVLAVDPE
ncbi:MAG: hypothetical protein H0T72_12715 [Chloroflexia bacterium]|nr:hypothetical protein [Chloroflexia bacterium]